MVHNTVVRNLGKFSMNLWNKLPPNMVASRSFRTLGGLIHRSVCRYSVPRMGGGTYFLRNVPLLNAVAEQIQNMYRAETGAVRLCVIGCCTGAEVYSTLWVLHRRFPQIPLSTIAMDISADSVACAEAGRYMPQGVELARPVDVDTLASLFDRDGDVLVVKSALRQNIRWLVGDAGDPGLAGSLGLQDVVLANNFLIHMNDREAASCMSNVARLVRPGGLFVCRGVALPLRERVVQQLGFKPLACYIEEIHNADEKFDARKDWPWRYWALEPIDKSRKNWTTRYASMFQAPLVS